MSGTEGDEQVSELVVEGEGASRRKSPGVLPSKQLGEICLLCSLPSQFPALSDLQTVQERGTHTQTLAKLTLFHQKSPLVFHGSFPHFGIA